MSINAILAQCSNFGHVYNVGLPRKLFSWDRGGNSQLFIQSNAKLKNVPVGLGFIWFTMTGQFHRHPPKNITGVVFQDVHDSEMSSVSVV